MNVPAASKVCSNVSPNARLPESNDPSSAVTVWATSWSFVQVMVVPTAIVTVSGLKAKSSMLTVVPLAAGGFDVAGAEPAGGGAEPALGVSVVDVVLSVVDVVLSVVDVVLSVVVMVLSVVVVVLSVVVVMLSVVVVVAADVEFGACDPALEPVEFVGEVALSSSPPHAAATRPAPITAAPPRTRRRVNEGVGVVVGSFMRRLLLLVGWPS